MIVRPAEEGSLLITQPAHARLARQVMECCMAMADHPRRAAILHAVEEHDSGWQEEDDAPEIDPETGAVVDFIHIPVAVRQRVWPRSVLALADDPWAAALVAQHAVTVYERHRPEPVWVPFFSRMERLRDQMLQKADVPPGHLAVDYVYLRLGDLISLSFCTALPTEGRIGEWSVRWQDPFVLVSPDPFGGREIPLEITAMKSQPGQVQSSADLRDKLGRFEQVAVRGTVRGR